MIASPLAQHQAVRRHHCLVHACVNRKQARHERQLEHPPGFPPRPGEHQVPASCQGLSPCPDQDPEDRAVDEVQAGQVSDDVRVLGDGSGERVPQACGVGDVYAEMMTRISLIPRELGAPGPTESITLRDSRDGSNVWPPTATR